MDFTCCSVSDLHYIRKSISCRLTRSMQRASCEGGGAELGEHANKELMFFCAWAESNAL